MSDEAPARMPGVVYTFYSYKGGVGRSMALANVGVLLALSGKKVLLIDWDLEAPGLETYFRAAAQLVGDPAVMPGVVDLLEAHVAGTPLPWSECLIRAQFLEVELHIISSGRRSADYRSRVQKLDWDSMYREHRIGNYVNALREEWRDQYDFVLIDSRTGFTDIGDICTVLLPDAIVLMFVTSYQNVEGIKAAMTRAVAARKKLPVNRNRLQGIPLPARDEVYNEYEKSQEWKGIYARELGYLYEEWLPKEVAPADALNKLFIPYVTNWSFGERVPVLESSRETQDPTSIGAAYKRLTNLLASGLDWYSLETNASIEDLQATQIELQRERARIAQMERQRKRTRRLAGLSAVLMLAFVAYFFWREKEIPARAIQPQVVSTDLYDGRALLDAGRPDEALKVFRARQLLLKHRLDRNPAEDEKPELLGDYDQASEYAGDALLALGNSTDAMAAYQLALENRAAIVAKNETDSDSQRQLALRHVNVGDVLVLQGDVESAAASFRTASQVIDKLDEDEMNVRVRAFINGRVGSIFDTQGQFDRAKDTYTASTKNLTKLAEEDPNDEGARRILAVADYQIGNVLRNEGSIAEAMTRFRAFLAAAQKLALKNPSDRVLLRYQASANAMIGEGLRDQGNLPDARNAFGEATKITEDLEARYPKETIYQRDLATRYVAWGAVVQDQDRNDEAIAAFQKAEAIMRKLVAVDPANADWQSRLAVAVSRVGDVSTRLRKFAEAEKGLKEARDLMEGVVARDATNLDALSTLSFQYKRLGTLYLEQKRVGNAIEAFGKAEDMVIKLVQAARTSAYWRRHFIEITRLRSQALLMTGDVKNAADALELAQNARRKAKITKGSEVYWEPETARLEMQSGNVYAAQGRSAEARAAYVRAQQSLVALTAKDPTNVQWRMDLADARRHVASSGAGAPEPQTQH